MDREPRHVANILRTNKQTVNSSVCFEFPVCREGICSRERYCWAVELLPSDLNLIFQLIYSNKSVRKAKSTYWCNGKKNPNNTESGN